MRDVEFARFVSLTSTSVEPLSFTVPRVKSEYFQDDLFPPTRVTWNATLTAAQWFAGAQQPADRLQLKPDDMETRQSAQIVEFVRCVGLNVDDPTR